MHIYIYLLTMYCVYCVYIQTKCKLSSNRKAQPLFDQRGNVCGLYLFIGPSGQIAIWFEEIFFQAPAELWRTCPCKLWNRISHCNVWWCLDVQWTLSTLLDFINDWADHKQCQIALNFPRRKKSGMPDSLMIQNGKCVTNVPAIYQVLKVCQHKCPSFYILLGVPP